ncbi:MAG: GFA family protein [Pseudomonadales bacterium]
MSQANFSAAGRCECAAVSFEVSAPAQELYHCHCSRCRRLHGSLFASYAYVLREQITIRDEKTVLTAYESPLAHWHFCGRCGCHLFAEHAHNPGVMWYMVATLEEGDEPGHPKDSEKHIFAASASALEPLASDLPSFDGYASASESITSRKEPS